MSTLKKIYKLIIVGLLSFSLVNASCFVILAEDASGQKAIGKNSSETVDRQNEKAAGDSDQTGSDAADDSDAEDPDGSETNDPGAADAKEQQFYEDLANGKLEEAILSDSLVKKIYGNWIRKDGKMVNIRDLAGSKPTEFSVMQGGCSDGEKYAYFVFCDKESDAIKIVKFLVTEDRSRKTAEYEYVSSSKVLDNLSHGNDITYVKNPLGDGRDKILIITTLEKGPYSSYVGTFDVNSMSLQSGTRVEYWTSSAAAGAYQNPYPSDSSVPANKRESLASLLSDHHGFSAIAYNQKSGYIITLLKNDRDIVIFKPSWRSDGTFSVKLVKYIRQNRTDGTLAGIDCDDDFIYTSWSYIPGDNNILQIYDYNGKHIGDRSVTESYEIENLMHFGEGENAFYYSGYHYSYDGTGSYTRKVKTKTNSYRFKNGVENKTVGRGIKQNSSSWENIKEMKTKYRYLWNYRTVTKTYTVEGRIRNAYCMCMGNLRSY